MQSFSQRHGFSPIPTVMQVTDLDSDSRLAIWNMMVVVNEVSSRRIPQATLDLIATDLWVGPLKKARDEKPWSSAVWETVKREILHGEWFNALNITEAYVHISATRITDGPDLQKFFNTALKENLVSYKFIDGMLVAIDSEEGSRAIEAAFAVTEPHAGAREHLSRSARLLSDRTNPDFANSIKESISAVESIVRSVTGENTLGAGIKRLNSGGHAIHPALSSAWSKMYGWTSDADGIRHGSISPADSSQALAKYTLTTCSAFINYLLSIAE